MPSNLTIRRVGRDDLASLTDVVFEMLDHYRIRPDIPKPDAAVRLKLHAPEGERHFDCLLAFRGKQVVGILVYSVIYDPAVLAPSAFIKDLFVSAPARGVGVGRRLMIELARLAVAEGWWRIDWNADARPNATLLGRGLFRHDGVKRLDRIAVTLRGAFLVMAKNASGRMDSYGRIGL